MNTIKQIIEKEISSNQAISFSRFMEIVLQDSKNGYYVNQIPLGSKGDFTTSPEISQVFGELIGIWIAYIWLNMNAPKKFTLVELGAGKGTLMQDILRATKKVPNLHESLDIVILEINNKLIAQQKENLINYDNISWIKYIEELNVKNPVIFISNEFFDALAVKQYVYKNSNWHELMVTQKNNNLKLMLKNDPFPINFASSLNHNPKENDVYETSPQANMIYDYISKLVFNLGGAILTIDYGNEKPSFQNSIRGFKNHKILSIEDILSNYPNLDITYNVNFFELKQIAIANNINVDPIITQKKFLENMGIHERKEKLLNIIKDAKEKEIFRTSVEKLINPSDMGDIFKVFITHKL